MFTVEFIQVLTYGFYIITTIMQIYFLWNISELLKQIKNK